MEIQKRLVTFDCKNQETFYIEDQVDVSLKKLFQAMLCQNFTFFVEMLASEPGSLSY